MTHAAAPAVLGADLFRGLAVDRRNLPRMVFIGGWRRRRRGHGPFDGYGPPPPGYQARRTAPWGYRRRPYGGGSNCLRDMCLLEGGCCAAEMLGCGPQFALVGPSVVRRCHRRARAVRAGLADSAPGRSARVFMLEFLLGLIAVYRSEISPQRRACCRYRPTCSQYAATALESRGLRTGLWLTARRILRCRPGSPGGYDPVPTR